MLWIQHPVTLEDDRFKLAPLHQAHFPALIAMAANPRIWQHLPIDGTNPTLLTQHLKEALLKRAYGEQYPFTVIEKKTNAVVGATRLFDIYPHHKKLEIGWTWYHPDYWGSGCNLACKLLLLSYCFDTLGVQRVQLKTRDNNLRSQAAIKKIGALLEGVLRQDRIMADGTVRDTVVFSIIDKDWPTVQPLLRNLLANHPAYT